MANPKNRRYIPIKIILVLVLGISIGFDIYSIFAKPLIVGIDGYYYVLQLNSLTEAGNFYFPTNTPLILYFLYVISFFTRDAVSAIKIGTLILQILFYAGIFSLLKSLTKNIQYSAIGIFLAGYSVLHLYFLSEFLNNLGSLVLLIWGAFFLIKLLHSKANLWFGISMLLFLFSIFCHQSAIGLILGVSICLAVSYICVIYATEITHRLAVILMMFCLVMSVSFLPLMLTLPDRLGTELSSLPQNPFRPLVLMENSILLITIVVTIIIWLKKTEVLKEHLAGKILLANSVWGILLTLNPFLFHQIGINGIVTRLDILVYLQIAISVPILIFLLSEISRKYALIFALILMPLLFLRMFAESPIGLQPEYLENREKLAKALPAMRERICDSPIIIAPHGEEFLISAVIKVPAQQTMPVESKYQCVFWLIHQPQTNYQIIFESGATSSDGEFSLADTVETQMKIRQMTDDERRILFADNRHLRVFTSRLTR